ncbi:hypothetical protein ADH70_005125 [Blautia pseudococcoides]|uniref:Uncharacterized protein n=1 Tax=Blautia pseudococcoides TaxID=1796616 RepID=A0A1C7I7B8_9FIRM|nr:hypothetical protein A4V09_06765 [Blautia pseudococcoides]ASU28304.1 hypothetical protein ADH70_005125 [Blautia pseudococcoides]
MFDALFYLYFTRAFLQKHFRQDNRFVRIHSTARKKAMQKYKKAACMSSLALDRQFVMKFSRSCTGFSGR